MNRNFVAKVLRWLFLALAIFGVIGVVPIAYEQWVGSNACPAIGLVPACYVAFLGYALVTASAFYKGMAKIVIFLVGFVPIFGLAATGSGLELMGQVACPKSSGGTPMCFYSLALTLSLAALFLVSLALSRESHTHA